MPPVLPPTPPAGVGLGQLVQPSPVQPAAPPQTGEEQQALEFKWREFLGRPEVRAALLQFSVNILQPKPAGQTTLGAIGTSIGAAGGAAERVRAHEIEEEERLRRAGIEERQIATEEERTGIAGERVDAFRERTEAEERVARANRRAEAARLAAKLRIKLKIAEDSEDAQLLNRIIQEASDRNEAAGKLGEAVPPLDPAAVLNEFDRIKRGIALREDLEAGRPLNVPDSDVAALLQSTDPRAQSALRLVPPDQLARVRAQVEAATPGVITQEPTPKPEVPATGRIEPPVPAPRADPIAQAIATLPRVTADTAPNISAQARQRAEFILPPTAEEVSDASWLEIQNNPIARAVAAERYGEEVVAAAVDKARGRPAIREKAREAIERHRRETGQR